MNRRSKGRRPRRKSLKNSVVRCPEGRNRPASTIVWQPKFLGLFDKFINGTGKRQQVESLESLQIALNGDVFIFPEDTEQMTMFKASKKLLQTWMCLLENVDIVIFHQKSRYYDLIYHIMTRYEFDLVHFIDWENSSSQIAKLDSSNYQYQNLLMYRDCLYRTAHYTLNLLRKEVLSSRQRRFAVQCLVILYFRIPLLSGPILEILCPTPISHMRDVEEPEWKQDILRRVDGILSQFKEPSDTFFKQNPSFFQWVSLSQGNADLELIQLLLESKTHIQVQGPELIFLFLSSFISFVSDHTHGEMAWKAVPGFTTLVKSMFTNLCSLELIQYTFVTEKCLYEITRIPKFLSLVCECSIRSTRLLAPGEVSLLFGLLEKIFAMIDPTVEVSQLTVALPEDFCFDVFLEAIDALLDTEHFQVLSRTLLFIYINCWRFPEMYRRILWFDILLDKYFQKLFMHWSLEVRQFYQHLLVFCVDRQGTGNRRISGQRSNSLSQVSLSSRRPLGKTRSLSTIQTNPTQKMRGNGIKKAKPPRTPKSLLALAKSLFLSDNSEIKAESTPKPIPFYKKMGNPTPILVGTQPLLSSCHFIRFEIPENFDFSLDQ